MELHLLSPITFHDRTQRHIYLYVCIKIFRPQKYSGAHKQNVFCYLLTDLAFWRTELLNIHQNFVNFCYTAWCNSNTDTLQNKKKVLFNDAVCVTYIRELFQITHQNVWTLSPSITGTSFISALKLGWRGEIYLFEYYLIIPLAPGVMLGSLWIKIHQRLDDVMFR